MKLEGGKSDSFMLTGGPAGVFSGIAARAAATADFNAPLEKIRSHEKRLLHEISAIAEKNILFLNQVHGDRVLTVTEEPLADALVYGDADAMVTSLPRICLVIRTADCVPVFIYDKDKKVLGAIHSGWKGTQLDITGNTVDTMKEVYGSRPEDLTAWIYPSIGPASYEVNEDVACHFPHERIDREGRIFVNLWKNIENSLIKRNVKKEEIFNSALCNRQNTEDFFSHRFGDAGRNLNFAWFE